MTTNEEIERIERDLKTELGHVFERDLSKTKFELYYTNTVYNDIFDGFMANVFTKNTDITELKIAGIYGWYVFNLSAEDGFIKIELYHYTKEWKQNHKNLISKRGIDMIIQKGIFLKKLNYYLNRFEIMDNNEITSEVLSDFYKFIKQIHKRGKKKRD